MVFYLQVLVCKDVLKKYSDEVRESRSVEGSDVVILSDPVVIHTFMTLCKHLHEQVSAISLDDEVSRFQFVGCNHAIFFVRIRNKLRHDGLFANEELFCFSLGS